MEATKLAIAIVIFASMLPTAAVAGVYDCIVSEIKDKKEATLEEAKQNAKEIIQALPEVVGDLSNALADKIESTKVDIEKISGSALATPGKQDTIISKVKNLPSYNSLTATAYNSGADAISFLLRHWLWTLIGLGAIALYALFR